MPHRDVSPALSENEFDISKALLAGANDSEDEQVAPKKGRKNAPFDIGAELNIGAEDGGDSDDDAFIAGQLAAANRKSSNLKGRTVKKGGGFQAMGLNANLLKAITRKGFSVPTPIQRKTIPLLLDGQDVVGMARTGSGKTAAFVIPMIEKLKAHSAKVGARAVIMSPSRELALQTLKVVKELGRGTDLRTVLLVGGDSLEEQFSDMNTNPDIIIATPGRFLHLKVEMELDLSTIRYVVFDEADRLFEMGFAAQLAEILYALPPNRQTLLFSATLPKSLVEFARAGLQEPKLVRLDAESKVSPDLESAFFTVKSADKEGALLHILQDIIKMPTGETEAATKAKNKKADSKNKKRKRDSDAPSATDSPTEHSTIIFAATKHHVEYLAGLLRSAGYAVSYAYGSLDQTAPQPKIFIHRVGRTARAGRKGWSYSLVRDSDVPYLLDLQLFLSRKLILGRTDEDVSFANDVVVGGFVRDKLARACEWVSKLLDDDEDLSNLRTVAAKGEKLYMRTRNSASSESAKRAKDVLASEAVSELNMLFNDDIDKAEVEREKMLARISGFRPQETIFEIGKRGTGDEAADMMRKRREKVDPRRRQQGEGKKAWNDRSIAGLTNTTDAARDTEEDGDFDDMDVDVNMDSASEDELEITFPDSQANKKDSKEAWQDPEHFMTYTPKTLNLAENRGYGVHSGSYDNQGRSGNFVEEARSAAMDLNQDESKGFAEASKPRGMRWDKKSKKYVARANDEDGSKGVKYIRGESGQKIAASFRSGRFESWKKTNKIGRLPRAGETEAASSGAHGANKRFKHKMVKAPKEADKYRDDYHVRKKRVDAAKEKRIGRFADGGAKSELKGVDDVRKSRALQEKRRAKNARPSKKGKF
ncbi:RNA helicase ATP-dependent DEAD-box conserved site [Lasiodiplodia theobromae]|uniref:RNA helicase ATP-dependent DEAD-box conserved site n=1 Tax=Lasiodiplodia theobromae TaxID=45133 RepID=UPI0015C33984|nr:RNA helicase ATP-dependent DEAD-box conserved site [Lasiodiplodia theobromae]KAF4534236.1 RNA helicase ATP-dependent DEAD-box conserved site [Lasiodiplodia theobromae]